MDPEEKKNKMKSVQAEILAAVPGSHEAVKLFEELPNRIMMLLPKAKERGRFLCDVLKAVWYHQQGEVSYIVWHLT
jgi:hypothetical protein